MPERTERLDDFTMQEVERSINELRNEIMQKKRMKGEKLFGSVTLEIHFSNGKFHHNAVGTSLTNFPKRS